MENSEDSDQTAPQLSYHAVCIFKTVSEFKVAYSNIFVVWKNMLFYLIVFLCILVTFTAFKHINLIHQY